MKNVDLIIIPRWLITMSSQSVLENHALVIHNGMIEAICPCDTLEAKYQSRQIKKLSDHAVMPGFVNAHTHLPMNLLRGLADDLKLMNWLQNYIWPTEQKWLGEEFVAVGSRLAMAEMLKNGITCFNDMYFYPETIANVTREVGMRACIGIHIIDLPTAYAKTAEEYLEKGLAAYNHYQNELINFSLAPHSVYMVSDSMLSRVASIAKELGTIINIHAQETLDEINASQSKTQKNPLQRLVELGFPLEKTLLIHMTQIDENDWTILNKYNNSHIVHCPESNMKLASGYCPVPKLLKAGVNVALGTDGVASNNDLDMFGEMRAASFLAKMIEQDPEALSAIQTLELATINGARALNLDRKIGSLEVGKAADCIAVNLNSVNTAPVYHPISQLVYSANPKNVTDVWVAGKQLLSNQQLTTIDEGDLLKKVDEWKEKITANLR